MGGRRLPRDLAPAEDRGRLQQGPGVVAKLVDNSPVGAAPAVVKGHLPLSRGACGDGLGAASYSVPSCFP